MSDISKYVERKVFYYLYGRNNYEISRHENPRTAEGIRWMRGVYRHRQLLMAEFYDKEGIEYDWEEMKNKDKPTIDRPLTSEIEKFAAVRGTKLREVGKRGPYRTLRPTR